jgi:hypothetical protein
MAKTPRGDNFMPLLALMLAACAQSAPLPSLVTRPATPEDARYACQMHGAAVEAAYSGRRNFSIDSAMARSHAVEECMGAYQRTGAVPQ